MTTDEKLELKDYLMGSKLRMADALRDLGIPFKDSAVVTAEMADTILLCQMCGHWVDAAIVDGDGVCACCRE